MTTARPPDPADPSGPARPAELFDLSGKVAVVTGGSRGLGRVMATGFAAAGAAVVVASRDADSCAAVVDTIRAAGGRALAHPCHVGRWDQLDGLVDAAVDGFGRLDILVNNAGMSPVFERLTDVSEVMWDRVVGVNLKGPFRLAVLAAERMRAGGGGTIVNVSSVGSLRPYGAIAPYAAAKAGLNAITVALAEAFGPAVRVNAILPGPFRTDISAGWDMAAFEATIGDVQALGRAAEPAEILGAALYLASDASSFTTGALLRVDGGIR
ncbi:Uncharacterized oxidoreductase MexAM1_META1p0182 [Frankia canadensis]|uniref:Uncharacterized oxidoreductase MexAM1_META1p0182 n=1 Tax=Frankia canadensis TaxID=1836972 RepID=A0A2I2KR44_9ACTN|nr:glucose 1-dehydrogenase [Frankia canadensis]SNQ48138.1 Uncharacterized oxidoreductase MexAM1_META1p0182 [Frankia canadensis]SOU55428.1 Uncharacterized oxidoreductase MexAM1_META1p0182 [Frankia canadensis]